MHWNPNTNQTKSNNIAIYILVLLGTFSIFSYNFAQQAEPRIITLNNAVNAAIQNHPLAKNTGLSLQAAMVRKKSLIDFGSTSLVYHYGQLNSYLNDYYIEINQDFGSPFSFIQKNKVIKQQIRLSKTEQQIAITDLTGLVKAAWFQWIYTRNSLTLLQNESVYYNDFQSKVNFLADSGDSKLLERVMAETKYAEIQSKLFQASEEFKLTTNQMKQLMFINDDIFPADTALELYAIQTTKDGPDKFSPTRQMAYYEEKYLLKKAETGLERAKFLPEISGGYLNQQIDNVKGFKGWHLGILLPLWFFPQSTKIKESALIQDMAANELEYQKFNLEKQIENLKIKLDQLFVQISYYRENVLKQADLIEKVASSKYNKQEIKYFEFLDNINTAYSIRQSYIEKLYNYNTIAVELEHIIN